MITYCLTYFNGVMYYIIIMSALVQCQGDLVFIHRQ